MDLKKLASVTDAVEKIMAEALKGNQHKIDKNKNNKIDAHDFKLLRKEDAEQLDEYESKNGSYTHKGTYGYAGKGAEHGETDYKKANDDEKKEAKSNRRKYGARQNYVRSNRVNEFTDLLSAYDKGGLKSLSEAWAKKKKVMNEEPSNEEFTKEVEDQQAKMDGKKKGGDVAKPAVQAVQNEETHTEVEVIDLDPINGVQVTTIDLEQIEERTLTASETDKKEEVVKSMKKNLSGFKERYGKDAKSVMYATATKIAKEEVEETNEAYQSYSGPSHGNPQGSHYQNNGGFGRREREDDEGYENEKPPRKPMYPASNPTNTPQKKKS